MQKVKLIVLVANSFVGGEELFPIEKRSQEVADALSKLVNDK
jgi:hypothetical protein